MSRERIQELASEMEGIRQRINLVRTRLSEFFVDKEEVLDLMTICAAAQEPLLIVGKPGTAKSDLVVKFCQALGLSGDEYFEYMLTKFTEPGEIIGPVDISQLKDGKYFRRTGGKLPDCKIAFLDEIFKSNSAILNTLLTIINERKFYQDGQPVPVNLKMLFAATNEIPEFEELGALRDRFILKVESKSVRDHSFESLVSKGLRNETLKSFNQRPWEGIASLDDFLKFREYLDLLMLDQGSQHGGDGIEEGKDPYFPAEVFALFRRIIKTLAVEDRLDISDRKIVKLYKLMRTRALLFSGGVVTKDDLTLLQYIPDRLKDFEPVREKVAALLRLTV
ncbi:MAG: AAA family ATPase [Verrucomicrobiales bacterium]|nr:AAA family ATPase [Verrucomicrobiales bacterium]